MSETLKPETAEQVLDAVKWAAASESPLAVKGQGSKEGFGRAVEADCRLDLSGLTGIGCYEPNELFMTAGAATTLAEIEAALRQNNQQMAFEPADLGILLGGEGDAGTIGGAIACNLAGPRRIKVGAARDHFLGFNAVSGRGETFKSGGTVVKNVTGFDLSKLIAGSFGTLAVMTEVTFKVLPAPEKTRTVLVLGLSDQDAMKAMAKALGSSHEVSGAAHLPEAAAKGSKVSHVAGTGRSVTAFRVEGPGPSVEHRCRALTALLGGGASVEELHSENSALLWREICDVRLLDGDGGNGRQVWRLSVPPMNGAGVAEQLTAGTGASVFYDWGGGLIWLTMDATPDAGHETVRRAVEAAGGHATLVRAGADVRNRVPVFEPQTGALREITARIKEGFDPKGILNPGRMVEGV
ncbi:MAG TPA: FAD-binding protein [Rhodospirillales bacterium]|nr:MAG: putative FAD-linked oxidoreductase [Alphaproteobacteria bacterium MarineAlpha3_Bin3]HIM43478.1 FAD-binding protein [Rhodospirillales bacterium]